MLDFFIFRTITHSRYHANSQSYYHAVILQGQARGRQDAQAMKEAMRATGPCVRLTDSFCGTVARLQRLFFLNEGHDLSRFTVSDVGVLKYPSYVVQRTRPVFPDRPALLDYEAALRQAAALDDALEACSLPPPLRWELQWWWWV